VISVRDVGLLALVDKRCEHGLVRRLELRV